MAKLNHAVEQDDPQVGSAVLAELATLSELLKATIWERLSTDAKAEIKRMQRQVKAKEGDKCEVRRFRDAWDDGDDSYVWKPATLISLFDKAIGQGYWIFNVDGKNVAIHGRDEWRLIDAVQNE